MDVKNMTLDHEMESAKPFVRPDFDESTVNALKLVFSKINFDERLHFDGRFSQRAAELWNAVKKGDTVKNLILILVDSFGMANFGEHQALFSQFNEHAIALDTCFPTTTATVMTSLSYGTFPSEHGIVGYNFWHESLNELVNCLNLKTIKDGNPVHVNTLKMPKSAFITGSSLAELVLQKANDEGLKLNLKLFKPEMLERDGIIQFLFPHDHVIDYPTLDPSPAISEMLRDLSDPSFDLQLFTFYFPHADHASHYFGSKSKEHEQALYLLGQLLRTLTRHSSVLSGDTALVLTSDHGQVDLPKLGSKHRVVIENSFFKELRERGLILATTGRMLQLYYQDDAAADRECERFFEKIAEIQDHIQVLDKKEVISLFGPTMPSEDILSRIGDKIILMDEHVFIDCPPIVPYGPDLPLKADHGSLTPREVKVPFIIF